MQASLILRVDDQEDWADSVRSRGGIFQPEDWRESHLLLYIMRPHKLKYRIKLGSKFGTWLIERQLTPKYAYMGTTKEGLSHRHVLNSLAALTVVCSPSRLWRIMGTNSLPEP